MRTIYRIPIEIKPELVEIGDEIQVQHQRKRGITMILHGIVAQRNDHGATRFLATAEGADLLAWSAAGNRNIRVYLLSREEKEQPTLFDIDGMEEVRERIA